MSLGAKARESETDAHVRQSASGQSGLSVRVRAGDSYSSSTAAERVQMWSAMWGDVKANPPMGRGQDDYLRYYPPSEPLTNSGPGGGAHNFPIEVWHAGASTRVTYGRSRPIG